VRAPSCDENTLRKNQSDSPKVAKFGKERRYS
jgi:hypothetical protein